MTGIQIAGIVIAASGIVWAFVYPAAKGDAEVGYGKATAKSLTQGLVIVVIGALLIYFGKSDDKGGNDSSDELTVSEWATQANAICDEAIAEIRALNVTPANQFQSIRLISPIVTRSNQKIQAVGLPSGAEAEVRQVLNLASDSGVQAKDAYDLWAAGRTAEAQAALNEAQRLTAQLRDLDGDLGANVCAAGL